MMSAVVMGLLALFGFLVLLRELVTGSLNVNTTAVLNATIAPQGTASSSTVPNIPTTVNSVATESLGFGTTTNNCDLYVCQDRTLGASANESLDLYGGGLNDVAGVVANFRHVKFIMISIVSGGDINGLVIGNATNPFVGPLGGTTPTVTIYTNGVPFLIGEPTAGFAVGSTSNHLKIANGSGAVTITYRLVIGGTST